MRRISLRQLMFLAVGMVAVGAASYLLSPVLLGQSGGVEAQAPGQPTREALDQATADLMQRVQLDALKPRFLGRLGDFEVVATEAEASPIRLCGGAVRPVTQAASVQSELNRANMSSQIVCADGTVVATYRLDTGMRGYFTDVARVDVNAPADRIEQLMVGTYPALLIKPQADLGPYFAFAILRSPVGNIPGIMISMMVAGTPTRDQAIAALTKALAE